MNLVLPQCNMELSLNEDEVVIAAIENPKVFTSIASDIWEKCNGGEGRIILSDCDNILNYEKTVVTVFNPLMVNCNEKKIISKLYKEIQENALTNFYDDVQILNGNIVNLIEEITNAIPYGITFDLDLDLANLLKMYSVSVAEDSDSFLDKLINYFKVMHRIVGYSYFTVFDLRQYLSTDELERFYEFIRQEHLGLFILEGCCLGRKNDIENIWILDQDLCIINIG